MATRKFTAPPCLPPSPVISFYDGSARLNVDGTTVLVHGSVIRCESEVFSDALMPFDTEKVDMLLPGDRLEDVLFMIRVMYGKINIEGPLSAAEISTGFRMFGRFKMHACLDQLYRKITHGLPVDLAGFDRWWFDPGADVLFERGAEIDIFSTLRSSGLHARYPVVMYRICLRYTTAEIKRGVLRKDGSLAILGSFEKNRCLVGRQHILDDEVGVWLWTDPDFCSPDCKTINLCLAERARIRQLIFHLSPNDNARLVYTLRPWDPSWDFCKHCHQLFLVQSTYSRHALWDRLPAYFGHKTWAALEFLERIPRAQSEPPVIINLWK
ncbi:hypothetical protein H0H93_004848 [Arthromyces matolae]|nr:hypothetical protein H0H93_004848 [Arthromyces matolae]